ncbi:MAG: hypothetical protein BZ138_06420 [Methanosphaera sp. rholeuAM270]|nr:MAG: hypothetical protein BZ138_06420 [Methanosphaera sp. rholeuAM270]
MEYEVGRLVFKKDQFEKDKWWAIDADNIEFCVERVPPFAASPDTWKAMMQHRLAWNSVSQGLGAYDSFDEACLACAQADTEGFCLN